MKYDDLMTAIENGVTAAAMENRGVTKCYLGKREMAAFNEPGRERIVLKYPAYAGAIKRRAYDVEILPSEAESEIRFEP